MSDLRPEPSPPTAGEKRWFVTTHWSVVLAAKAGDDAQASAAMEKLCRTYWPPLYAFVRRQGHESEEAKDLVQEFFTQLLERKFLEYLRHQQGRFRSFLLTFLKHFLSEQRRRAGTQRRGGGRVIISLDAHAGDEGYMLEPVDNLSPDEVFERRWAQAVFQNTLNRLRGEFAARGQARLFEQLQDYHPHEPGGKSLARLSEEFGLTEAAVKSILQRMRRRHRELLREEIAQTVARPEEIEEELRHFRGLLR